MLTPKRAESVRGLSALAERLPHLPHTAAADPAAAAAVAAAAAPPPAAAAAARAADGAAACCRCCSCRRRGYSYRTLLFVSQNAKYLAVT